MIEEKIEVDSDSEIYSRIKEENEKAVKISSARLNSSSKKNRQ